jgi:ubiquinone/menaquinone biosynthesis C-methylase UbiE
MRIGVRLSKCRRERYSEGHRAFYEQFFNQRHVHEARYDLRSRLRRQLVSRAVAEKATAGRSVIVDVGCGVGDVINSLKPDALRVAMSYSRSDLELARDACARAITFVSGSATDLPFASASVDIAICLEVIEHLPDDRAAIRELARILKRPGSLLISAPSHFYYNDYLDLIGHHRHYSRDSLADLLASEGLRIVGYIDQQEAITALHYYPYVVLESIHLLLNRCAIRADSMYVRPHIGRLYGWVSRLLTGYARERNQASLAADESSTFVIAERMS